MKKYYTIIALLVLIIGCTKEEMQLPQPELQDINVSITAKDSVITSAQAQTVANKFFNKTYNNGIQTKSSADVASIEEIKSGDETLMYVINYLNGGFVIVSANTNYYPVIAYSKIGRYNAKIESPANTIMLEEMKEASKMADYLPDSTRLRMKTLWRPYIQERNNHSITITTKAADEDTIMLNRIAELEEELANDEYNYTFYKFTTSMSEGNFPDSDVMFNRCRQLVQELDADLDKTILICFGYMSNETYGPFTTTLWHPLNPYNYLCANNSISAGTSTIALAQLMKYYQYPTTFNWSNMPNSTATVSTQNLIRDINSRIGSESIRNVSIAIASYGYDTLTHDHSNDWVINYIVNNKPVIMRGYDNNQSHTWLCDGYNTSSSYSGYFLNVYKNGEYVSIYENPAKDGNSLIPTYESPYIMQANYSSLHMNWGLGPFNYDDYSTPNTWFSMNDVSTHIGTFNSNRINLYVTPINN